jgi:phosphohistidine phosphatase
MKTLLLLRHAKSSWKDDSLDDHDRPLNKRGKREAPRMGQLLKEVNLLPDLIVSSSARRARKTAEHVIHASGYRGETRFTGELYDAPPQRLLEFLAVLPESLERVLVVGHNPGLEELLESLTGEYRPLSTASLAQVELPIAAWSAIADRPLGRLANFWQPRELD